jgi:hypothetical protein
MMSIHRTLAPFEAAKQVGNVGVTSQNWECDQVCRLPARPTAVEGVGKRFPGVEPATPSSPFVPSCSYGDVTQVSMIRVTVSDRQEPPASGR